MKVLLLENEFSFGESVVEYLKENGFVVNTFSNGRSALEAACSSIYDIFLFDVKVPGLDGFEVARAVRKNNIDTPIIFMTSKTEIEAIEEGYSSGCCDYMKKPFLLKELKLRMTQALKSSVFNTKTNIIQLPLGYSFDMDSLGLYENGMQIYITRKEGLILALLIEKHGQIVTTEAFEHYVWNEPVDAANVRVHINHLRKKLHPSFIVNVRGFGYKIEK